MYGRGQIIKHTRNDSASFFIMDEATYVRPRETLRTKVIEINLWWIDRLVR